MKDSKEKRIKKLKTNRLWPSIAGLVIIVTILGCIMLLTILNSIHNVMNSKILIGVEQTQSIVKLFEKYEGEHKENIQESVLRYIEMAPEMEAIWVSDLNGNKIWASGSKAPDIKQVVDAFETNNESIKVIIEEDEDKILSADASGKLFSKEDIVEFVKSGTYNNKIITQIKIWYVKEVDNLKVYVLKDINLYSYDCYTMFTNIIFFAIMVVVFILYYMFSFVRVMINMHRTSKVIYTDMVTGGNNWLYFVKKGNKLLKKNYNSNYAVIHFKMRKYRSFCTCFGVKEGEVLIEKLYNILKTQIMRKELMVYKENASFGLVLSYTDEQQLRERIEYLMGHLNIVLPNMKLYFVAGIYKVCQKENDIEQLYNNAVLACDMLGDEIENKIIFYDVEMNNRRLWERKVEDDMHAALARHEFQVYLQPKISTEKECLAGAEALVRWIHPQEGFIPPNKFIPIFERNGFILKLDDYMLEEIARQQAEWIKQGRKVVPISVNVSRAHFTKEDLAEHICGIVDKYQVPHDVIELELTESAFFDDKQVLLQTVKKLREAGFIVSMDDFGAGYSSLNSLKELQLDVLKLDADFFRGTEAEERGMLIVSEVIDLAKKLNMKIVAEGIESKEQVEFLTEQECDLIQGYFYAKPMPIAEFEQKYSIDK